MESPIPTPFVLEFVRSLFLPVYHHKLVLSIAHATLGVMHTERLSIHGVGRAMADARGVDPKHAIKQVDRLLSNPQFELESAFSALVPFVVAARRAIVVALDWTEYADDGHSRIVVSLISEHGRAIPLIWRTHRTKTLKKKRNDYEDDVLDMLARLLPPGVNVTVLADRGFGDTKFYEHLRDDLEWDFIIRFREVIYVAADGGPARHARDLVAADGKPVAYDDVGVTSEQVIIPRVVAVHDTRMKEPWLLAGSRKDLTAADTVALYARRFTIEETFRDEKDQRFGLGLIEATIGDPDRRDRLLLLVALATLLLTLLGKAGEQIGLDRKVRANTASRRTHSLFRQGREYLRAAFRRFSAALAAVFQDLLQNHLVEVKTTSVL